MPLYEYECFVCQQRFERIQKVTAEPVKVCPGCGGSVRRLLGSPALQFKGSGWYVTDYGKSDASARSAAGSESSAATSTSDSTEAKKSSAATTSSPSSETTGST